MKIITCTATLLLLALACGGLEPPTSDKAPLTPQAVAHHSTDDGNISASIPPGDGWNCTDMHKELAPDNEAWLVKCKLQTPNTFFFMIAKDYTVPKDQITSSHTLVNEIYPKSYGSLFDKFTISNIADTSINGHQGHAYQLDATHKSKGAIRKSAQVVVVGNHTFILTAEGSPKDVEANKAVYENWKQSVQFKALQ